MLSINYTKSQPSSSIRPFFLLFSFLLYLLFFFVVFHFCFFCNFCSFTHLYSPQFTINAINASRAFKVRSPGSSNLTLSPGNVSTLAHSLISTRNPSNISQCSTFTLKIPPLTEKDPSCQKKLNQGNTLVYTKKPAEQVHNIAYSLTPRHFVSLPTQHVFFSDNC